MPQRDESITLTPVKMVSVPQSELDKIEAARLALFDLLKPQLNAPIAESFSFHVKLQEITQPMLHIANRRWDEVK